MTRLKKLLVAGLMAVITLCVSISSAIFNVSQSVFSWLKVRATTNYDYSNSNTGATTKNGDILEIVKIPTECKVNPEKPVEIPKTVATFNVDGEDTTNNENAELNIKETIVSVWYENNKDKQLVYTEAVDDHKVGDIIDENQLRYDEEEGENPTKYLFYPSHVGTYHVQYAVKNAQDVWTVSKVYNIKVTKEAYTMELLENDPIILPTQIDTRRGVSTDIKLPLPKMYDEEGKQILKFVIGNEGDNYYVAEYKDLCDKEEDGDFVVALDENNVPHVYNYAVEEVKELLKDKNIYTSYYTYVINKVTSIADVNYGLYVEAYNPQTGKTVYNIKDETDTISIVRNFADLEEMTADLPYIAGAFEFTAGAGNNIIRYQLRDKNLVTTLSYLPDITIEGNPNVNKNNIKLGTSRLETITGSLVHLNEKNYLPKISASDLKNDSNSLNAYYYYEIEYVGNTTDDVETNDNLKTKAKDYVVLGQDEDGLYFIPKKEGTYNIYYNAKDFYGNTKENASKENASDVDIFDNDAPKVKITKSFDADNVNEDIVNEDYSYIIPTKYYTSSDVNDPSKWTTITIPAMYITDNFLITEDGSLDYSKFNIIRTIKSYDFKNHTTYGKTGYKAYSIQDSNGDTNRDIEVYTQESQKNPVKLENVIYFDVVNKGENENFYTKLYDGEDTAKVGKVLFYANDDSELTSATTALIKAKTSQVAYITLNPNLFGEGEYTIEFEVSSKKTNDTANKTTIPFKFKVVYSDNKEDVDATAPTVKFEDNALVNVKENDTIVVNKPTINDDVDTGSIVISSQTGGAKNVDREITYNKYYVLIENVDNSGEEPVYTNTFVPLPLKDKKLTFNMSDPATATQTIYDLSKDAGKIKVVCFSYDDFADLNVNPAEDFENKNFAEFKPGEGTYKNIGYGELEITVKNAEDTVAPKFSFANYNTPDANNYDQFAEFLTNGITFYDNTANDGDSFEGIKITAIDSKGNSYDCGYTRDIVAIDNTDPLYNDGYRYKYTLSNISFLVEQADNYTINFAITDEGNNSVNFAYVLIKAQDKKAPKIEEVSGIKKVDTMELGESRKIVVSASDNSEDAVIKYIVKVTKDGKDVSYCFNNITNVFTPKAIGTYTINIKVNDGANDSEEWEAKVAVNDNLAPTIDVIGFKDKIAVSEQEVTAFRGDDAELKDKFAEVELPDFTISDANNVPGAVGTVTISGNVSGKVQSYTITKGQTTIEGDNPLNIEYRGYNFYFTPTERGEYTVVYSGKDANNKPVSNQKTLTVTIGDTVKPTIELNDELIKTLNNGFVLGQNTTLKIDNMVMFDSAKNMKESKTDGDGYVYDVYLKDNDGFKNNGTDTKVYTKIAVQVLNANGSESGYTHSEETNDDGITCDKFVFDTAGNYTVKITATDNVGNSYTRTETLKVTAVETSASESSKVLGTVLIIASIVILAGVVIYFVRGTKFLPKKKKAKKVEKKEENKD